MGQALGSSTALNLGKAGLSLPLVTWGGGLGLQPGKLVLCFCILSSLSVPLPYIFQFQFILYFLGDMVEIFDSDITQNRKLHFMEFYYLWYPFGPGALLS